MTGPRPKHAGLNKPPSAWFGFPAPSPSPARVAAQAAASFLTALRLGEQHGSSLMARKVGEAAQATPGLREDNEKVEARLGGPVPRLFRLQHIWTRPRAGQPSSLRLPGRLADTQTRPVSSAGWRLFMPSERAGSLQGKAAGPLCRAGHHRRMLSCAPRFKGQRSPSSETHRGFSTTARRSRAPPAQAALAARPDAPRSPRRIARPRTNLL